MVLWLALAAVFLALGVHGLVTGQILVKDGRRYTWAETPVLFTVSVICYYGIAVMMVVLASRL